jgi:large subunit ribosomal protein L21
VGCVCGTLRSSLPRTPGQHQRGRSVEDLLRLLTLNSSECAEDSAFCQQEPVRSCFAFAKARHLWNCGQLFLPREVMTYAIIRAGGRQFRVAEGETLDVDLLNVEPGKTATFADVLLFADGKDVTHGNPVISGAKVTAEVVEQRKDKKVIAFKYKRRKGYHRTVGHRRKLTRVKIKSINIGSKKTAAKKAEE